MFSQLTRSLPVGLLAVVLIGCGTAATGPAVEREDGSASQVSMMDGGDSALIVAKRIIADIEAAPLSRDRIEAMLGVTLQPLPDQPFPISRGTVAGGGPFSEVEFREARLVYLLILTVRSGVSLPLANFWGDVIPLGTPRTHDADAPVDPTEGYRVVHPPRQTAFSFGESDKLLRFVTFEQSR
jgi:hypothetical protein